MPSKDFLAGMEEGAQTRVEDAVESIMVGFEGTELAFQLAYNDTRPKDGTDDEDDDSGDVPAA
uniref:Uncharacterized protein n=1 Tax=Leersia perrieri TaxID=77586 RepID=A0A0D9W2R1_9ORYZ